MERKKKCYEQKPRIKINHIQSGAEATSHGLWVKQIDLCDTLYTRSRTHLTLSLAVYRIIERTTNAIRTLSNLLSTVWYAAQTNSFLVRHTRIFSLLQGHRQSWTNTQAAYNPLKECTLAVTSLKLIYQWYYRVDVNAICHLMQPFAKFCCQKRVLELSNYIFYRHAVSSQPTNVSHPLSYGKTP
jgi:hypothetical protein